MKNKLIPKAQKGMRDLHDPRLKRDSGHRGIVDTYDNNTIQLNLPTIEVRPEGVELTDQDKYKQSYENLIYTLRSNGYNNLADDVQKVGQTQGIGNALYHYQDMINRRSELLKSKGSQWDENEAKRMGVAAMSAPYAPLAAIGAGKLAGNIIGNIVTNPLGFATDVAIGTGMSKVANKISEVRTGKDIYERAQERYPNDPVKATISGMLRDPGTYVGFNTILRGKNAYKLSKNIIEAGGIKNYRIAKAITDGLDNATPGLTRTPINNKTIILSSTSDQEAINQSKKLFGKYKRQVKVSNKVKEQEDFIKAYNDFASKYGYKTIPDNTSYSKAKYLAKQMIARHNSFGRGFLAVDNMSMTGSKGEELMRELILHGGGMDDVVFATQGGPGYSSVHRITPGSRSKSYLIRRNYKLGNNPIDWFKEGDFPMTYSDYGAYGNGVHGLGTGNAPYEIPSEVLIQNEPIHIVKEFPYNKKTKIYDTNKVSRLLSKKFIDTSGNKGEVVSSLATPDSKMRYTKQAAIDNMFERNMDDPEFYYNYSDRTHDLNDIDLLKERLETGGWEKLGISDDMQIKYQGKQVNAKEFLRHPQFIPMPSASYLPDHRFMTFDSNAPIRKQSMEKAHELFHAADHVYLETLGDAVKQGDDFISMGFPGVDYSQFDSPDKLYYFTRMGGTEMKSRFSQLKNYFKIKNANTPLTLKQWEFAKKHYPFNNHMTDFFNSVKNPKEFLNTMNKIVPVGVGISFGINQFNNKTEDNKIYNHY